MYNCYFTSVANLHGPIVQYHRCDDILMDIPQNNFFSGPGGEDKYFFISWEVLNCVYSYTCLLPFSQQGCSHFY